MNPQQLEEEPLPIGESANEKADVTSEKLDRGLLTQVLDETLKRRAEAMFVEEQHFNLSQRRATMFAASGLFSEKDIPSGSKMAVARAMVKIELGEGMGFSAAEALQGIYLINGVTSISSALRAARMQAVGYGWSIQWHGTHDDCKGCTLWLTHKGQPLRFEQPQPWTHAEPPMYPLLNPDGSPRKDANNKILVDRVYESFLESDALKMKTKIWEGPKNNRTFREASILEKDNWKMSRRNMYFARTVTNSQRFYAPAALSATLMSAEEAMDLDTGYDPGMEPEPTIHSGGSRDDQMKSAAQVLADLHKKAAVTEVRGERLQTESSEKPAEPKTEEASAGAEAAGTVSAAEAVEELSPSLQRVQGLEAYVDKVGAEVFGRLLKRHKFEDPEEVGNMEKVSDDDYMSLIADLEDALKAKRAPAKPVFGSGKAGK